MDVLRILLSLYFISLTVVISLENESSSDEDANANTIIQELIDPHSFNYNRHRKEMEKPNKNDERLLPNVLTSFMSKADPVDSPECNCEQYLQKGRGEKENVLPFEAFSKRLVNLIISHIDFKEEDEIFSGNVFIKATSSQIQVLRDFGNGKASIRQIDAILSDIIKVPSTSFFEEALTYSELVLLTLNKHVYTCIAILVVISFMLISRYVTWTRGAIILLIVDLIFVTSFFMTWYQLVKEAEVKQLARQMMYAEMPIECQPEKMGVLQQILSKFSSRESTIECEKYYEVRMMDPVVKVTPAHALSHMCTNFILHPVSLIGHMVADFIENATAKISWPMSWFVTPSLFIGITLAIILLPFSLFGGSLGFGIGHLFHFNLSGAEQRKRIQSTANRSQERIELIQEVPKDITIQRIEPGPESIMSISKSIESSVNDKEHENGESNSVDLNKAKGDSLAISGCNEESERVKLKNEENFRAESIQEVGSGDG